MPKRGSVWGSQPDGGAPELRLCVKPQLYRATREHLPVSYKQQLSKGWLDCHWAMTTLSGYLSSQSTQPHGAPGALQYNTAIPGHPVTRRPHGRPKTRPPNQWPSSCGSTTCKHPRRVCHCQSSWRRCSQLLAHACTPCPTPPSQLLPTAIYFAMHMTCRVPLALLGAVCSRGSTAQAPRTQAVTC